MNWWPWRPWNPPSAGSASPGEPAEVKRLDGAAVEYAYHRPAGLLEIYFPAGETNLAVNFGTTSTWGSGQLPSLRLDGRSPIPMSAQEFPLVRRLRYTAGYRGAGGHREITVKARNPGLQPAFLTVSVGNSETGWSLTGGTDWQELTTPALAWPGDGEVTVTVDGIAGRGM